MSKLKTSRAAKAEEHPFFCHKKKCRKTAWETPEYLTQADLRLLERLDGVDTEEEFSRVVFGSMEDARGFFHRTIGWPEGLSYMRGSLEYRQATGWPGVRKMIQRALTALEMQACASHAG